MLTTSGWTSGRMRVSIERTVMADEISRLKQSGDACCADVNAEIGQRCNEIPIKRCIDQQVDRAVSAQ